MKKVLVVLLMLVFAGAAAAQKIELAGTVGGYVPVDPSTGIKLGRAVALQGNVAFKIAGVPLLSAYLELPVVGGFNTDVVTSFSGVASIKNYSSLFITPGLKLKVAPSFPISPFVVADIGVARFKGSSTLVGGTTNPNQTVNKVAFAFGGGLDMKIAPFLSLRGEVRDFYSGLPSFTSISLSSLAKRQHNVVPSAGLVVRF